jgi:Holliday junction resolvasome RuvABC endonuclease subunit
MRFAALDPGQSGALVLKKDGVYKYITVKKYANTDLIRREMRVHNVQMLVTEQLFAGRFAKSAMTLGYEHGVLVGQLTCDSPYLTIVEIHPSTWKSELYPGVKGRDKNKKIQKSCIDDAANVLDISSLSIADREGVADAYAIHIWFEDKLNGE